LISPLALVGLMLCAGCARPGGARPTADTAPLPDVRPVTVRADIDALAQRIIPQAVRQMHWAMLRTNNQVTALRIDALTPDDRYVDIRAQQQDGDRVQLQVKVGYFGDRLAERQFIDAVGDQLDQWQRQRPRGRTD
jgi:hypothetical protein